MASWLREHVTVFVFVATAGAVTGVVLYYRYRRQQPSFFDFEVEEDKATSGFGGRLTPFYTLRTRLRSKWKNTSTTEHALEANEKGRVVEDSASATQAQEGIFTPLLNPIKSIQMPDVKIPDTWQDIAPDMSNISMPSLPTLASMSESPTVDEITTKVADLPREVGWHIQEIKDFCMFLYNYVNFDKTRAVIDLIAYENEDVGRHPEIEWEASLRQDNQLCDEEQTFLRLRRSRMKDLFAEFIGVPPEEVEEEDIPRLGLACSGGGYRAMIASAGYIRGMQQSKFWDMILYYAGVSGSCWAMYQLYSELCDLSTDALIEHFETNLDTHFLNLSHLYTILSSSRANQHALLQPLVQKYEQGKKIHLNERKKDAQDFTSLVDLFGILIESILLTRKTKEEMTAAKEDAEDVAEIEDYAESLKDLRIGEENGKSVEQHNVELYSEVLLDPNNMKMSKQKRLIERGEAPMPIYCIVRHEVPVEQEAKAGGNDAQDEEVKANADSEQVRKEHIRDAENHGLPHNMETEGDNVKRQNGGDVELDADDGEFWQWIEVTPFEVGSEEFGAWLPTWAFGRRFEEGKSIDRVPEQHSGIWLGVIGSAFTASIAKYYQEVRGLLPQAALERADDLFKNYEKTLSNMHPVSPGVFPNPFYHMPKNVDTAIDPPQTLLASPRLELMDAGMDNNIPFYPLLRTGRDIDIVVSLDLSADIQDMPYLSRVEGYAKRRGIQGWPVNAKWPGKEQSKMPSQSDVQPVKEKGEEKKQRIKYALGPCTVFESESTLTETTMDAESTISKPENVNPITLIYIPLIPNPKEHPHLNATVEGDLTEFDPQKAEFCSTWNFVYTPEQVRMLARCAEANWYEGEEQVRQACRSAWKRKKNDRRHK